MLPRAPSLSVYMPEEVLPGEPLNVEVVLQPKRPVRVDRVLLQLHGQAYMVNTSRRFLHLARVAEIGQLESEERRVAAQFEIPARALPTYDGAHGASVRYTLMTRLDIPWWPDLKKDFRVVVGRPPAPRITRTPLVFVSHPAGAPQGQPYFEASLDAQQVAPGMTMSGRVATKNIGKIKSLTLTLSSTESFSNGVYSREAQRYTFRLGAKGEDQSVPFRLTIPETVNPSFADPLLTHAWFFGVAVRGSRGNVDGKVAITMAPAGTGYDEPEAFDAPLVGSDRADKIWLEIARDVVGAKVTAPREMTMWNGRCSLTLTEETRDGGALLVGTLRYPNMHLSLRAGTRDAGLFGHRVNFPELKTLPKGFVARGRDDEQVRAFLTPMLHRDFGSVDPVSIGDEEARFEFVGSAVDRARVRELAVFFRDLLRSATEGLNVPLPLAFQTKQKEWLVAAQRLGGQLEPARCSIHIDEEHVRGEIVPVFADDGACERIEIRFDPERPCEERFDVVDGSDAQLNDLSRSATGWVEKLLETATRVRCDGALHAELLPGIDPAPCVTAFEGLRALAIALAESRGPYR